MKSIAEIVGNWKGPIGEALKLPSLVEILRFMGVNSNTATAAETKKAKKAHEKLKKQAKKTKELHHSEPRTKARKKPTKTTVDTESFQVKRKPSQIRKKKAHVHIVSKKETLSGIAQKYGTTIAKLKSENNIKDVNKIRTGQKIRVPEINVKSDPYKGTKMKKKKKAWSPKKIKSAIDDYKKYPGTMEDKNYPRGAREADHPEDITFKLSTPKKADTSAAREMFKDVRDTEDLSYGEGGPGREKYKPIGKKGTWWGDLTRSIGLKGDTDPQSSLPHEQQSGGMIGQSDMTAKRATAPKAKRKIPQYYKKGGSIKAGKKYAYGGRVAKYKE